MRGRLAAAGWRVDDLSQILGSASWWCAWSPCGYVRVERRRRGHWRVVGEADEVHPWAVDVWDADQVEAVIALVRRAVRRAEALLVVRRRELPQMEAP